ncbi:MAG: hypothetical protein O3A95_09905 [Planctomycetota bacterium]|nr:hypothetical protein [Planctomycetota bacterium]MDA1114596.1 hypothetical protein [Planctomycetota bacterium]
MGNSPFDSFGTESGIGIFSLPLGLFLVLIVILVLFGTKAEKKRRESFRRWAKRVGWSYSPNANKRIPHEFPFLNRFQEGYDREAYHVFAGEWKGYPASAFEYQYTTSHTDSDGEEHETTHHVGVVMMELERSFPELRIYPEHFLSRIGQFLGGNDIDLESIEFSNAFTVEGDDKKFAYDFCNTSMMTYLLQYPKTGMELEYRTMALFDPGHLKPETIEPLLNQLSAMRERMPEYLFQD